MSSQMARHPPRLGSGLQEDAGTGELVEGLLQAVAVGLRAASADAFAVAQRAEGVVR
jgi:hypothetical protein